MREGEGEKGRECTVGTTGKAKEKRGGLEMKEWVQSQQAKMAEKNIQQRTE